MPGATGKPPVREPSSSARASAAAAANLLDRTVQQIPTIIGRLAYLASLRDPASSRYRHVVLGTLAGEAVVESMLHTSHRALFFQWLGLNLAQQRGDLTRYAGYETREDAVILRQLLDRGAFALLPPDDAEAHERQLFLSDLTFLLQSLIYDDGRSQSGQRA
jgi:hypothetical protein